MKKFLLAPVLTVLLVFSVVFGTAYLMRPEPAQAEPVAQTACVDDILGLEVVCAEVVGNRLVVKALNGQVLVDQPLPQVTVSGPTIRVTLPRVTVTRPPVTVTLPRVTLPSVTVPGPVVTLPRQTVTIELPRATTTATLPGQTTTVRGPTVTGQRVTTTPTVVPVTVTASNGQRIQTSVTITPSPVAGSVTTKPVVKEKEVRVSVPAAIGIGVGVLLLGLILGLLAIYTAYTIGYKDSENAERSKWRAFRDEIFGKKTEGEN